MVVIAEAPGLGGVQGACGQICHHVGDSKKLNQLAGAGREAVSRAVRRKTA